MSPAADPYRQHKARPGILDTGTWDPSPIGGRMVPMQSSSNTRIGERAISRAQEARRSFVGRAPRISCPECGTGRSETCAKEPCTVCGAVPAALLGRVVPG